MVIKKYHLQEQEIPDGFQVFAEAAVAGVSFRKGDAKKFAEVASRSKVWLELEREPNNQFDKNAIKIIGCNDGFLGTNTNRP